MSKEQYVRSNRVVMRTLLIILVYLAGTLMLAIMSGTGNIRVAAQVILSVIAIVGILVGYKAWGNSRMGGVIMLSVTTVCYGIICMLNRTQATWLYTLPILMVSMAYLDVRITVVENIAMVVINVVRLLVFLDLGNGEYQFHMFTVVFLLLLAAISSISITRLLCLYNKENVGSIQNAMEVQKSNSEKITMVADSVSERFTDAMDMVGRLEESVNTANFAMENIADSTESTAQAIQAQVEMCARIQGNTSVAAEHSRSMTEISTQVSGAVAEGVGDIQELKNQAGNVEEASGTVVQVIDKLTHRVEDVQGFVGSILNISSQTNLLSLNASIEAARAGEAGKGFAVVADEIRQLSEQTKEASNSITQIIQELNEDTKLANESIQAAFDSMMKQNEMIVVTGQKFDMIDQKAAALSESILETEQVIREIVDASNSIAENLTHLSATSEEVAASSGEGLRNTVTSVEDMNRCKEILEQIFALSQGLKENTDV